MTNAFHSNWAYENLYGLATSPSSHQGYNGYGSPRMGVSPSMLPPGFYLNSCTKTPFLCYDNAKKERKNDMSLVYASICQDGIVFTSDSRLVRQEGNKTVVVTDEAPKIFKNRNFMLAHTGMADVLKVSGTEHSFVTIKRILSQNPECSIEEFFRSFEEEVSETLSIPDQIEYHFYVGFQFRGEYRITFVSITNTGRDTVSPLYDASAYEWRVNSMGAYDIGFNNLYLKEARSVNDVLDLHKVMMECSMRLGGTFYKDGSPIGGPIQQMIFR